MEEYQAEHEALEQKVASLKTMPDYSNALSWTIASQQGMLAHQLLSDPILNKQIQRTNGKNSKKDQSTDASTFTRAYLQKMEKFYLLAKQYPRLKSLTLPRSKFFREIGVYVKCFEAISEMAPEVESFWKTPTYV